MQYFFQPLTHIRNVARWARTHGARHRLDVESFRLEVDYRRQVLTFEPRFLIKTDSGMAYSPTLGRNGSFVGWLPYSLKRWPIASDKLRFKQYCEETRLPTPTYWLNGDAPDSDFIIKDRLGSFGQGIYGPYHAPQFAALANKLRPGAYCEEFIDGDAIKIWYWNDAPIFMERLAPPFLVGDGRHTIIEIAALARGSFDNSYKVVADDPYLAWQGVHGTTILDEGQSVKLAYRYTTPFDPIAIRDRDVLEQQSEALRTRLHEFGQTLARAITPEIRRHVMFTLDAVATSDDRIFLLEMNCNPMVHPLSYVPMLDDIFNVKTPHWRDEVIPGLLQAPPAQPITV